MTSLKPKLMIALLALSLVSCKACEKYVPFDIASPLEAKWERIRSWIPGDEAYIGIADVQNIVNTPFFMDFMAKDKGRSVPLLKGLDFESQAGIIASTGRLVFIGGKFDPKEMTEKIVSSLRADKVEASKETYKGFDIYSDSGSGNSFVFLEKFLLCQGAAEGIKKLIDEKKEGKIEPPHVETTHQLWLKLNKGSYGPSNMVYMIFAADVANIMKLKGSAKFSTPEEAQAFADQLEGIKTIKTIQSFDKPWLAELLNNIAVEQGNDIVRVNTSIDVNTLRKVLKGF